MTYNPLTMLDDQSLADSQLALALACGRSKSSLKQKHRQKFCFLMQALKAEADQRGTPTPVPPYKA